MPKHGARGGQNYPTKWRWACKAVPKPLTKGAHAADDRALSRAALPDQALSIATHKLAEGSPAAEGLAMRRARGAGGRKRGDVQTHAGVWLLTRSTYRCSRSLPILARMRRDTLCVARKAPTRADCHTYDALADNTKMVRQTECVKVSEALTRANGGTLCQGAW